jgi:acyl dehydratase
MFQLPLARATFEAMEIGQTLGPVDLTVDDHEIKSYCFTTDDYHPWITTNDSPFNARVAPAALLVPQLLRLLNTRFDPNTEVGIHQKEEVWFHSPIFVGEKVRTSAIFVDKYVKRGFGYIVTEAEARAVSDGRLLVKHRCTEIAEVLPGTVLGSNGKAADTATRRVSGLFSDDLPLVDRAAAETSVGSRMLGQTKVIHQDQMSVFSNVQAFWRSLHTDLDRANQAGFRATIAQGLMQTMYASELGTTFFGESWFTAGWLSMSFLHPLYAGDSVTAKAVVVNRVSDRGTIVLEAEFWLENQDSVKTAVGWLRAPIAKEGSRQ